MKTFIFNSETTVYISNAETRDEAIENIRRQIQTLNSAWVYEGYPDEKTINTRLEYSRFKMEDFDQAINNQVRGMQNYEIGDGDTIVYDHGNE